MSGASHEPRNAVERAADAAFAAVEEALDAAGARAVRVFVLIRAEGVPEGEVDAVVAGHGYEGGTDLFAELVTHMVGMGRQIGMEVVVVPLAGRPPP